MLAEKTRSAIEYGHPRPRIAPPRPLRHDLAGYREVAAAIGIDPMPWQEMAVEYLTAKGRDGRYVFRETAVVVARQNGKTTLCRPLIMQRLLEGRRILHIAQVRQLPGVMFEDISSYIESNRPDLLTRRRGRIVWPRRTRGDESITLNNGGTYRIAAAMTGAARGFAVDDLLIDELREMEDFGVTNSASHTQRMSQDPQTIYLSNAGTDDSVILNSLRARAPDDPSLAYLEWSADPEYDPGDRRGWLQANPSIGHYPQVIRDLEQAYTAAKLGGNMAGFETEALCRWVHTMRPGLVDLEEWQACRVDSLPRMRMPKLALSMDPDRKRASAVVAWLGPDDICYLTSLGEETNVKSSVIGQQWRDAAAAKRITAKVGFDPLTDAELAKFFRQSKPISGMEFANATSNFVERVKTGRLRWAGAEAVGADLPWTARKENDSAGSYIAVRANDDRPVTASLAAIRAVWLATGLRTAPPRIY